MHVFHTTRPSQPPSLLQIKYLNILQLHLHKLYDPSNLQQLKKELFGLKIIGIVDLEFVLYCISPFTLVALVSQA